MYLPTIGARVTSCEHHHGDGEGCAHGAEAEPCADHDEIGKRVAAAARVLGDEDHASPWTSNADETLVALVANQGPRDWEAMVEPLLAAMASSSSEQESPHRTWNSPRRSSECSRMTPSSRCRVSTVLPVERPTHGDSTSLTSTKVITAIL